MLGSCHMENGARSLDDIVSTCLRYYRTHDHADFWAAEWVMRTTNAAGPPPIALDVTLKLLEAADTDELIGAIADGPFGGLLMRLPPELYDRVQDLSRSSENLRRALAGIWVDPSPDVVHLRYRH